MSWGGGVVGGSAVAAAAAAATVTSTATSTVADNDSHTFTVGECRKITRLYVLRAGVMNVEDLEKSSRNPPTWPRSPKQKTNKKKKKKKEEGRGLLQAATASMRAIAAHSPC